ncbi:MAG: SDR family oxidoreductase [Thermodesulfobacteriota bacterium]
MADIRFDGRVAIVTGAGAGIGREYALELARRGAKVVVNDLGSARDGSGTSQAAADKVVDEIKAAGGQAAPNYDNVATVAGGEAIVKTAVDTFGRVDILINNAGILRDKSFVKMEEAMWDAVIAVHLKGAFCVTQPASRVMKDQNYGRIIMTTSTSGLYGNFGQTNYGAAKLGLVGFMNTLKLELAKNNVKVNAIAPTAFSRMTEDIMPPSVGEKMQPKFNVPLVMYLCSEECPVSGNAYVMGAGWYARTALVCAPGVCLGDTKRDVTVEEIRDNFASINNLDKAEVLNTGTDVFKFIAPLLA